MLKLFSILLLSFIIACKPNLSRSNFQYLPIFNFNSILEISYPNAEYFFEVGKRIEPIVPTLKGKVESCSAEPSLPGGLNLSQYCVITGIPMEVAFGIYKITGKNASTSGSKDIALNVKLGLPGLNYPNSPYVLFLNQPITINPTVTGGISSCSISPALPSGLNIDNVCNITGSPSALLPSTNFVVTATNLSGSITTNLSLQVKVAPTVSFDTSVSTGSESVSTINIPVSLSLTGNATINYSVTGGTASGGGVDFTLASGSLNFTEGGVTTENIVLNIINDSLYEMSETITITLNIGSGALAGTNMNHTYTITDDDPMPTVSFDLSNSSVNEASGTMNVKIIQSAISGFNTSVPFSINATSTASDGNDFTISSPVTIPAGSNSVDIIVNLTNDVLDEEDETLVLNLGTPTGATGSGILAHTLTILDDDPPPTVQFVTTTSSGLESTSNVILDASLSSASAKTVTVNYSVTGGTASAPDFVLAPGTITFNPGETTKSITLIINNDTTDEPDETLIVGLTSPTNATLGTSTNHIYTITDDDLPPTVQFTSINQSNSEATTAVSVTVQLSAISGLDITVPYSINASSSATLTSDYSFIASPIVIPAGSLSGNISFTIVDDTLYEGPETIIVDIGTPTNATLGTNVVHTITITNDDPIPVISLTSGASISIGEGATNYGLGFTLSTVSGMPVTVVVNTADGTAIAGSDYAAQVNQVVTIPAGSTTGTLLIPISEDLLSEGNETFSITMSGPGNASLSGINTQTVTILDNDIGITGAITMDCNGNGKIDHYKLSFASNITDSSFPGYIANAQGSVTGDWSVSGYSNVRLQHGSSVGLTCAGEVDIIDDNIIYIVFDEGSGFDTGAKPDLTTTTNPIAQGPFGTVAIVYVGSVFEADGARPVVVGINPGHLATSVPANTSITGTFSEPMNTSTFIASNFIVNGGAVAGAVSMVDTTNVRFTPTLALINDQTYTISIANMQDVNTLPMINFSSSFSTAVANKVLGTVTSSVPLGTGLTISNGISSVVVTSGGTSTSYQTSGNILTGSNFSVSIIAQPVGQYCTLIDTGNNLGGVAGASDIIADVNCVNGFMNAGASIQSIPPAPIGQHLYRGNVTAFAGNTQGSVDGTGTGASFDPPIGITFDGQNFYVADGNAHKIRRISAGGVVSTIAGNGTGGVSDGTGSIASLNQPRAIVTDGTYLYVSEYWGHRIKRIRISTGHTETIAGDNSVVTPTGTSLDAVGTLARFNMPAGLALDGNLLFIAERMANRVRVLNLSTKAVTTLASGGSLNSPEGLVLVGNFLYVVNITGHSIVRIDKVSGTQFLLAGTSGSPGFQDGVGTIARFNQPHGIFSDGTFLYVSDYSNNRIRQIEIATQKVTTLAGNGLGGNGNGIGVIATMTNPFYIVSDGRALYATSEYSIRKITNNGLSGYWALKQNTVDYSGESAMVPNGVWTGTESYANGRYGEAGGSVSFNGSSSISTKDIYLDHTASFTLSAWIYRTTTGTSLIFAKNSYECSWILYGSDESLVFTCWNSSGSTKMYVGSVGRIVPINQWTHVLLRFDHTRHSANYGGEFFVNGKNVTMLSSDQNPGTNVRNLTEAYRIGSGYEGGGTKYFTGNIADMRAYDRALGDGEIHDLAQMASPALVGSSYSTGATGLLAHYNFNGLSMNDSGPLNMSLTNWNSATARVGKDGDTNGSVYLNGTNNALYSSINADRGLPMGASPRTQCAWIFPEAYPANDTFAIIALYGYPGYISRAFALALFRNASGVDQLAINTTASDAFLNYKVNLNTWSHVCAAYNGGTPVSFYVNGSLVGTANFPTALNTNPNGFRIGNWHNMDSAPAGSQFFKGKIDDVRIYNSALTALQIRQLATQVPNGLVFRMDFNGDAQDVSGFGPAGTVAGPSLIGDRFGTPNSAYHFTPTSGNVITAPDSKVNPGTSPRTMCFWYRQEAGGFAAPFGYGNPSITNGVSSIWLEGDTLVRYWGQGSDINANVKVPYHTWRHICVTNGGGSGQIFVNGALAASGAQPLSITSTGSINIGSWVTSREYGGQIDDPRIYNRVLSLQEIQTLSGYHPMQVSSWNPNGGVSSMKFHIHADSLSNLSNGANVTTWIDASGNDNIVTAVGNSPTYMTSGIGQKPSVKFVSANSQYLKNNLGTGMGTNSSTAFFVIQRNSTNSDQMVLSTKDVNSQGFAYYFVNWDGSWVNRFRLEKSVSMTLFDTDPITSTTTPFLISMRDNSTSQAAFINGQDTTRYIFDSNDFTGGGPLYVGATGISGPTNFLNADLSEILYFNVGLSNTDMEIVQCYLSAKYKIPVQHSCP